MIKTLISAAKTMVSVVALLLAFTFNASAQDRAAAGAQRMTDNMKTDVSLNDEQYAKVLEINKDFIGKTQEARKATTDKNEVAKSVKRLNDERETKLKTVLTEEQYKKYLTKKEEKRKIARQSFNSPVETTAPTSQKQ